MTAQSPEKLRYDGRDYEMHTDPLAMYFKLQDRKPPAFSSSMSTALWRGYRGEWSIDDGKLYLVKLQNIDGDDIPVSNIMNRSYLPVLASWYSGRLCLVDGKLLEYRHGGYGGVYERNIILQINQGNFAFAKTIDNTVEKDGSLKNSSSTRSGSAAKLIFVTIAILLLVSLIFPDFFGPSKQPPEGYRYEREPDVR